MQSKSFLSHQRGLQEGRATSNGQSLLGMQAIPTDNHIRAMLDPADPPHLQPAFDGALDALRRHGGLAPFQRLGERVLAALDGTERFCPQRLACPQCLTRKRTNGRVESRHAMQANWVSVTDARGKATYDGAFVTSLPVTRDTVGEIVACARARWKIENESFNALKSNGCHLEHNFGHGKQNLAMMFAAMNLPASAIHTVCDGLDRLWIDARAAKRARKRFFEHVRTITAYLVLPDWQTLMQTLIDAKPPPNTQAPTER